MTAPVAGIGLPKFSRVIEAGSGPPRTPVSRASSLVRSLRWYLS